MLIPKLDDPRVLRNVLLSDTGYRLLTWETGNRCRTGQCKLGYAFWPPKAKEPMFSGEDFGCSPMDPVDSDAALRGILGFLTLRPGDTDAEYFDDYTDAQRAFAESEAEQLQEWGADPNDSDYPDEAAAYFRFVDVEEES